MLCLEETEVYKRSMTVYWEGIDRRNNRLTPPEQFRVMERDKDGVFTGVNIRDISKVEMRAARSRPHNVFR